MMPGVEDKQLNLKGVKRPQEELELSIIAETAMARVCEL